MQVFWIAETVSMPIFRLTYFCRSITIKLIPRRPVVFSRSISSYFVVVCLPRRIAKAASCLWMLLGLLLKLVVVVVVVWIKPAVHDADADTDSDSPDTPTSLRPTRAIS